MEAAAISKTLILPVVITYWYLEILQFNIAPAAATCKNPLLFMDVSAAAVT